MTHIFRKSWGSIAFLCVLFAASLSFGTDTVYLTTCCGQGATVSSIDAMMLMEMGNIPAQSGTTAVTMSPDNMTAFVGLSTSSGSMVQAVDVMMGMVMMTFPAGNGPAAIAITPDGTTGYIANQNDGTVTVFNPSTGAVAENIPVVSGGACLDIGVSPDSTKAYVVCQVNQKGNWMHVLGVIGNNQLLNVIQLPGTQAFPGNNLFAISPDGTSGYVAGLTKGKHFGFAKIDLSAQRLLKFVRLPSMSYGLAVHPMYPNVLFSSGNGVLNYVDANTGQINGTANLRSSGKGGVVPYMGGMRVAVASVDDDLVAVVDDTDGQLTASIPVGARPERVVVSDDEMTSLSGNTYTTVIHEFNASTGTWIADIEGGTAPMGMAFIPNSSMAMIVDQGISGSGSGVNLFDTSMNERIWQVSIPGASNEVMRPDGRVDYVGSTNGNIYAINTKFGSQAGKIALGSILAYPGLAASPDSKTLYATYSQANTGTSLAVISTATKKITNTILLSSTTANSSPFIATSSDGTMAYVVLAGANSIAVVDLTQMQIAATINLGSSVMPSCLALQPNAKSAYVVANTGIVVVDLRANTVAGTIPISGTPQNVSFTSDGSMAYVSVMNGEAVVIDTAIQRIVQSLPVSNTIGVAIAGQ